MPTPALVPHGFIEVQYAAGVPFIARQDGSFDDVQDNGVGNTRLILNPERGIFLAEACIIPTINNFPGPGPGHAVIFPTASVTEYLLVTFDGAGVPRDTDCQALFYKRRIL